jgi:hypothetical protein
MHRVSGLTYLDQDAAKAMDMLGIIFSATAVVFIARQILVTVTLILFPDHDVEHIRYLRPG